MEDREIIMEENKDEGLPSIIRIENTFYLTKSSTPQFAYVYNPLFDSIDKVITAYKNIIIDFKLGYFNSSSNNVIKKLMDILSENSYKCQPIVNWYYYPADEMMQEKGDILRELNPKIKFNLIELKD